MRNLHSCVLAAALCWAGAAPAPGQAGPTDEERRPNIVAPLRQFGAWGSAPGQLLGPRGAAIDSRNRILVTDTGNHRLQAFLSDGTPVAAWGKRGGGPGEFLFPSGIAAGAEDRLYVADTGNGRIQMLDSSGRFVREWKESSPGAVLVAPTGIAASKEAVAVVEPDAARIQVFTPEGRWLRTIGGSLVAPAAVAWDEQGSLFVADAGSHRIQVFDAAGKALRTWGLWGHQEGLLARPSGLALGPGRVFVADSDNHRIQVFDREGAFLYQWGRAPARMFQGDGRLHFPEALAVSPSGGLTVVGEPLDHRLQVFANGSARKITPARDLPWWDDLHARLHSSPTAARPIDPKVAPHFRIPPPVLAGIVDAETESVLLFNLATRPGALVCRIGGYGRKLGEFSDPAAVGVDPRRKRIYVADRGNRRIQVFELPLQPGSPTGFAPAARAIEAFEPARLVPDSVAGYRPELSSLEALALDSAGNLLVADGPNAAVLVFDPKGAYVRAVRLQEDGVRAPSRWTGVASNLSGSRIYAVDAWRSRILAFDREGRPTGSWGTPEEFPAPAGVAVDADERVYVTDRLACEVRKFDPQGRELARWGGFVKEPRRYSSPLGITFYAQDGEVPERLVVNDVGFHRGNLVTMDGKSYELLIKGGSVPPPIFR